MSADESAVLDMTDVVGLLAQTRERALRVRCRAVIAGARRRVKPYRMVYDLTWYRGQP